MDSDEVTKYRLAHDEAVRTLSQQEGQLNDLHGRTGALIAAATLATAFLGGQALRAGDHSCWAWVALGTFIAFIASALWVLWPTDGWLFNMDADVIIDEHIEHDSEPSSLIDLYRDLARFRAKHANTNGSKLVRLYLLYRIATILLAVEIAAWVIELGVR